MLGEDGFESPKPIERRVEWLIELDREAVRPDIDPKADRRLRILPDSEPLCIALDRCSSGSMIRAC